MPAGVSAGGAGHAGPPAAPGLGARAGVPPLEWFIGPADVVHGTNFVVPPTRRAARVVTVHDLTTVRFPELCDAADPGLPGPHPPGARAGAWVHTPSAFVAAEVVEVLGADPERVRAVPLRGARRCPPARPGATRRPRPARRAPTRYVLAVGTAEPRKDLPGAGAGLRPAGRATGPTWPWCWPGPTGWGSDGAGRRHRPPRPVAGRVVRTGWVDDRPLLGVAARRPRPGLPVASTRGSGSRPSRPWRPACRWWPPRPGPCPRSWATPPRWCRRATPRPWPGPWPGCSTRPTGAPTAGGAAGGAGRPGSPGTAAPRGWSPSTGPAAR